MQKYKYKFSPLAYVFMAIGFLIAIAVVVFNTVKLATVTVTDKRPSYILSICLCGAFILFELSLLLFSYYTIDGKKINLRISFICTGEEIAKLVGIVHFTNIDKLAIYFNDVDYMLIIIDKSRFSAFVDELKNADPSIEFRAKEF